MDALTRQGHKIDWYYRFASYNPFDDSPGHVFVIIKQGKGDEIWIDPVLDEFDRHKSYTYAIDKKVKSAAMNGIGLLHTRKGHEFNHGRASMGLSAMSARDCVRTNEERMGSVQSTGQAIMKVSPALAVVPVVGWIAAGAGEVVGGLLSIFGKSTSLSSGVDKLIERYQYLVLGQNVTSYHNVNENYKSAAQNWFSVVLGVPVYDVYRFYALADLDPNTLLPLNNSYAQRAANYFKSAPETVGVVTTDQAIAAAQIAATMPIIVGGREVPPGSWSNRTAAPSLVTSATGSSTSTGLSAGLASFLPAGVPMWVIIGAGVTILYFILNQPKTRAKKH